MTKEIHFKMLQLLIKALPTAAFLFCVCIHCSKALNRRSDVFQISPLNFHVQISAIQSIKWDTSKCFAEKKAQKKKATHTHSSLSKRLIGQNKAPSYTQEVLTMPISQLVKMTPLKTKGLTLPDSSNVRCHHWRSLAN